MEQRMVEMTPDESDKQEDEDLEPKKGVKGMSVDSPIQPPSPPAKLQSWEWDIYYHQSAPRIEYRDLDRDDKMWCAIHPRSGSCTTVPTRSRWWDFPPSSSEIYSQAYILGMLSAMVHDHPHPLHPHI